MAYVDRRCRRYAARLDGQGFTRCTKDGAYWQGMDGTQVWLCREPCSFVVEVTDTDARFIFMSKGEPGDAAC